MTDAWASLAAAAVCLVAAVAAIAAAGIEHRNAGRARRARDNAVTDLNITKVQLDIAHRQLATYRTQAADQLDTDQDGGTTRA